MANLPPRMWLGVERVVVSCTLEGADRAELNEGICKAVAAEAAEQSNYPVAIWTAKDGPLDQRPLRDQHKDLVLNVIAHIDERKLTLSVQPERGGVPGWHANPVAPVTIALASKNGGAEARNAAASALSQIFSTPGQGVGPIVPPRAD